ncbi:hypothetical protein [Streptomyces pulveraceus]|uniref:Uncharacterized protein n=1 Tax=Streptomyces pulveraceus TaxID=68258 RepID=A0ABW1GLM7_9ACTN
MTIKVYQVDRHGQTNTVRPKTDVIPLKGPPESTKYPPCEYDRCSKGTPRHIP